MGLSRADLFAGLGIVKRGPDLDAMTELAYEELEEKRTGRPRTAFFASQFPLPPGTHCGRRAVYGLLGAPDEIVSPKGRAIMEQGKAAEDQIVYRWGRAGKTIAGSVPLREGGPIAQLRLDDPQRWLTGRTDAVLRVDDWPCVLPVDVKSKSANVISAMKNGAKKYDPYHRAQVLCYVHMCRLNHEEMGWEDMGLLPASGGMLFYVSRDNPRDTVEFFFPYVEDEVATALEKLDSWRESYEGDELPSRPREWRWTAEPCKWCPYKKLCKQDIRNDVERASDSTVLNGRDYVAVRDRVIGRWKEAA